MDPGGQHGLEPYPTGKGLVAKVTPGRNLLAVLKG
jgi:hypothetical protein